MPRLFCTVYCYFFYKLKAFCFCWNYTAPFPLMFGRAEAQERAPGFSGSLVSTRQSQKRSTQEGNFRQQSSPLRYMLSGRKTPLLRMPGARHACRVSRVSKRVAENVAGPRKTHENSQITPLLLRSHPMRSCNGFSSSAQGTYMQSMYGVVTISFIPASTPCDPR